MKTAACAKSVRNDRDEGVGLFAWGREAVGSVKMGAIAVQITAISVAANPEKSCTKLHNAVCYAKWPTTFVGQGHMGNPGLGDFRAMDVLSQLLWEYCL